jgi:chromosome partitioning protein
MARTIAVALPKGGVGKTTTAVNLAASLAVAEQRTLLIDLDTIGAAALALGITGPRVKCGLYEVFNFISSLPSAIHTTDVEHLDFVPSNVQTIQAEERVLRVAENRGMLRNALRAVAHAYDYIILDCPPSLRGLSANALTAADTVLIPVKSGNFALDAVDRLYTYIDHIREVANRGLSVEGILLTMHEPHTRVSDMTVRELTARYPRALLDVRIPKNALLGEASFQGKPAILVDASSKGAAAYLSLARELIARANAQRVRTGTAVAPAATESGAAGT